MIARSDAVREEAPAGAALAAPRREGRGRLPPLVPGGGLLLGHLPRMRENPIALFTDAFAACGGIALTAHEM